MLAMLLIENMSALLMMLKDNCQSQSAFRCCVVCISRLRLLLSLSDRVPVVLVALGGKGVLAMILIADVFTLLMLIMDC